MSDENGIARVVRIVFLYPLVPFGERDGRDDTPDLGRRKFTGPRNKLSAFRYKTIIRAVLRRLRGHARPVRPRAPSRPARVFYRLRSESAPDLMAFSHYSPDGVRHARRNIRTGARPDTRRR